MSKNLGAPLLIRNISTDTCDVTTSTGTYSCIRMQMTFSCVERTTVKACYDEDGALTFPLD